VASRGTPGWRESPPRAGTCWEWVRTLLLLFDVAVSESDVFALAGSLCNVHTHRVGKNLEYETKIGKKTLQRCHGDASPGYFERHIPGDGETVGIKKLGGSLPKSLCTRNTDMALKTRLNNEPNPAAVAPQVATTPHQVAFGNATDKASTIKFDGDRPNKINGRTSTKPADLTKTHPVALISPEDSGPQMASTPPPAPANSSESQLPDISCDAMRNERAVGQSSDPSGGSSMTPASQSDPDPEVEVQLVEEIGKLWSAHNRKSFSVRQSREELNRVRNSLAKQLHAYKALLVGTGRNGRWATFLKERGIPVKRADRYVKHHAASSFPLEKKLDTVQLPPTAAEVTQKVKKLAPGLIRFLPSPESVSQFMQKLGAALQPSTPSA
jgi:hypothetical protein